MLCALLSVLFLAGCATSMESRLNDVRKDFAAGEFKKQTVGDRNLDPLLQGNALFQQGAYEKSDKKFEEINRRMADAQSTSLLGEIGRAASGQMAGNYRPYFMDDLFVSYYQIWDALALGRPDIARVVINQSYDKQVRLSAEYAKLINNREKDSNGLGEKLRAENSEWESFSDIMHPALMYLAGIYFLNFAADQNDFETARIYLSRADGMMPGNTFVKRDLANARRRRAPEGAAWIFIESGFAPRLSQRRIDWPFFTGGGLRSATLVVSQAHRMPDVARIDGAELVADVDAMFMTEWGEYSVNESLRALASVVSKLALQAAAHNQSPLAGLAANVYSMASASAEIRSWVTLPKHVSILRIDKGIEHRAQGKDYILIPLKSDGNIISEIQIPKTGNHLIYIRMIDKKFEPKIINLN